MEPEKEIKRGDIYYADLDPVTGSEQGGIRPVLVIQNDVGNKHSPTVIIAPFTSKLEKPRLPTHVFIRAGNSGLSQDSIILLEHIRTIDKSRLIHYCETLDIGTIQKIDRAIQVSFGLKTDNRIFDL